jgi:hypothetical protein
LGSTCGLELGLGEGVGVGLGVGLVDGLTDDDGLVPGLVMCAEGFPDGFEDLPGAGECPCAVTVGAEV